MNKKRVWGVVAFVGVLVVIFMFFMHQNDKKYIDCVKQGSPLSYPNITYGKAFDNYFGNCKWSYFVSDKDEDVVEFNGKCSWKGKDADIKIQFLLDYDAREFEVWAVTIDDMYLNGWEIATVIEMVFEGY